MYGPRDPKRLGEIINDDSVVDVFDDELLMCSGTEAGLSLGVLHCH